MTVYIHAKQAHKRKRHIVANRYELEKTPDTLRELITILVLSCVEDYNLWIRQKEPGLPLGPDDIDAMTQIGKIGFGIPFGSRKADPQDAVETAIQGFEDGLFRIFVNDTQIESLDAPLALQEEDTITIIRLVMLTGGFF